MRTTTIGDVKVLLPELEPDDLDTTVNLASGLTEALAAAAGLPQTGLDDDLHPSVSP